MYEETSKGPSNLYGNSAGQPTEHINYPKVCVCCNEGTIEDFHDICLICGWEDDEVQNSNEDFSGGANKDSLKEHRKKFIELRKKKIDYMWCNTWKY